MTIPASAGLEVRVLPITRLRPAPYNPRLMLRPGEPPYRKLKASLQEFGLVEPLVWNESSGHVVGGHARLEILRDLGVTEVPVSVVRLSEAREKALNVVLNNREAQGRFDTERLGDLLTELEPLPEMRLTGFDGSVLAALRLERVATDAAPQEEMGSVEVTLVMDVETYGHVAARLDELVGEFDLVSHVRRRET